MRRIAFFDLDGVIINGQSQLLFLKALKRQKLIHSSYFVRLYLWFLLYRLGIVVSVKRVMEYAFSFLKESEIDFYEERAVEFVNDLLQYFSNKEMIKKVQEHKSANDLIVLVTNSNQLIAEEIGRRLGVDKVLCTTLEIKDSTFTGRIERDMYGESKVRYVKSYMSENGLSWEGSYFYSDHISDVPLLEMVTNPIVVNPDAKFEKFAKKRKWKVVNNR